MKIEKFREMTRTDLERKLLELKDSLLKNKIKVQTKQMENTSVLSTTRRDIAKVLTLLKQLPKETPAAAPEKTPAAPAKPAGKGTKAAKPEVKAKASAKK
jgi:ribosomal protein L29